MDYMKIATIATRVIVTAGVGRIVNQTVKNNVTPGNKIQQITVSSGSFAIGGVVGNAAVNHAVETVVELGEALQSAYKSVKNL